jgi:hypothetical protein
MKRQVPKMTTDEEAEAFLEADLSDLDFSQFKRTRFKFAGSASHPKRASAKPRSKTKPFPDAEPNRSKAHK